jgi:hypothetical protein
VYLPLYQCFTGFVVASFCDGTDVALSSDVERKESLLPEPITSLGTINTVHQWRVLLKFG